jgi:plastocyanin
MRFTSSALLVFSALTLATSARASVVVVTQSNLGFVPRNVTIEVGDTVRWVWTSQTHTVTEGEDGIINGDEAWHGILQSTTPTFEVTFDAAFLAAHAKPCNLYDYFCEIHFPGDMRGTVKVGTPPGTSFCFGDGTTPPGCPCAEPNYIPNPSGWTGRGCANSQNFRGARLCASGTLAPDTLTFSISVSANYPGFGFMFKGNGQETIGVGLGDGIRCASGQLIRFGGHYAGTYGAPLGLWTYPNTVQTLPVSAATLQPAGQSAFYQLYYRNAESYFCTSATTNLSNAYQVSWP